MDILQIRRGKWEKCQDSDEEVGSDKTMIKSKSGKKEREGEEEVIVSSVVFELSLSLSQVFKKRDSREFQRKKQLSFHKYRYASYRLS